MLFRKTPAISFKGVLSTCKSPFGSDSKHFIDLDYQYLCHNYKPLPVVATRGKGVYLWDIEGREYIDCISGYSAVNQGHCHPKIIQAAIDQMSRVTLTSRAMHNDKIGLFAKKLTNLLGYDKFMPSNGGVESGEAAVKFARRWGYEAKKIPPNAAKILFCENNFWGRTIAACASSDDPYRYRDFGPFNGLNFQLIPYDDPEALERALEADPNVAAFMMEPIQGEGGVILPKPGYLAKVREICTKHNVLMIADEVQVGLGRCGKNLACEWENVRPDIVCLGKSLSGGLYPISGILADDAVMDFIKPGEHGSTFGGNPLAGAIGIAALDVMIDEKLGQNSLEMGNYIIQELRRAHSQKGFIKDIRGLGLFIGIEIRKGLAFKAKEIVLKGIENGVIAKDTHDYVVRMSPPLVINKPQADRVLDGIDKALSSF